MKQPNKFTFWDLKQVWAWDYSILANEKKKRKKEITILFFCTHKKLKDGYFLFTQSMNTGQQDKTQWGKWKIKKDN